MIIFFGMLPMCSTPEQLRGFTASSMLADGVELTLADFVTMYSAGARVVRLGQSNDPLMHKISPYDWNEPAWSRLHTQINYAQIIGMKVIIDPHTFPGTQIKDTMRDDDEFWQNPQYKDLLITLWERIAEEFQSYGNVIWGYDLMNEPRHPTMAMVDLNIVYQELIAAIRAIDTDHSIILEASRGDFGGYLQPPEWYGDSYQPLIFSTHSYQPELYAFQGVHGYCTGQVYPDDLKGWNKARLENELTDVINYAGIHGVHILIGEFCCSYCSNCCWDSDMGGTGANPPNGGNMWMTDLVEIFDQHGFSWCWHTYGSAAWFRSFDACFPNARWQLLRSLFYRNQSNQGS